MSGSRTGQRAIDRLPSRIIPDDVTYRVHYTDFYGKGEKLKFPENIRHISQKYEGLEGHQKLKFDISKIGIIHHQRKGDIPNKTKPLPMIPPRKYHLRVYDNFHYGDESEAYDHGSYPTYQAAVIAAKAIVDEFFKHNWNPGVEPDNLFSQYSLYGEDPVILLNEPGERERFLARAYASACVVKICRKPGDK